ncbi:hypothetical protein M407DRAFT_25311 [Tulasnella calospora MUT 4182]|uniref:Uncharacterized protein n=1 Tax=Tulasnella calospora MUT 4182 TaxID=1051891 RepID=A0A0C3LVK4_9AGAM|nr:hypothetical protein M407DRAFT_25311 [Tulasnella calospora MUT 4182]
MILPEPSQNPSGEPADYVEDAEGVDVPADLASENLSKRERGSPSFSGDADDNDDDPQVRATLNEGSVERGMGSMRKQRSTLRAQLLALVAAIDEGSQKRGSRAHHQNPTWIKNALGDNWENQLTTVLRDIDRRKKNDDTTNRS